MRSATLIRLLSVGCFVSTAFTERPMRKVHSHRNHGRNHGRNHSDSRHTRGTARPPKTAAECGALGGRPESFYICDGVSYCCGACTRESPCNFRGIELRGCACSASCSTLARESQAPPFLTEPTKRPALVATNHRHPWTTVIQSKSYEVVSTSKRFQVLYGVVNGVLVHVKSHRDRIDQDVINGRVLPFEVRTALARPASSHLRISASPRLTEIPLPTQSHFVPLNPHFTSTLPSLPLPAPKPLTIVVLCVLWPSCRVWPGTHFADCRIACQM